MGGGIGQGLAMGVGAAIAAAETGSGRKTLCLSGDGGFILNLGELATAVQEKANVVFVLMNDKRYGVIRNIQDAHYGGRRCFTELHTPEYDQLSVAMGVGHARVSDLATLPAALDKAQSATGPFILEIDMQAIGAFKSSFAGPPTKLAQPA
jgi:acetolactate synthase-1/2/3 large subunit